MSNLEGVAGIQRVAAFLLSLDRQKASEIMSGMAPEIVSRVAEAMLDLDPRLTDTGVVDELVKQVAGKVRGPRTVRAADDQSVKTLLDSALGTSAAACFPVSGAGPLA